MDINIMNRYKRKFEESGFKTTFKGTRIEITNIAPALGRSISDNLTFIIQKEIEKIY